MLERKEILALLRETKVIREGHFRLASGKHSRQAFQVSQILQYPRLLEKLCGELARRFKGEEIDVVVAPAIGGILMAYEVARALRTRCIFSERENGVMCFRRGFDLEDDENVLIVEDVITTGGTVQELIETVKCRGGLVRGVGVLLDLGGGRAHFSVHTEALISMESQAWEPEQCPMCRSEVPLNKAGEKK